MSNALNPVTRARRTPAAAGLGSLATPVLSVLFLTGCVPPVDQELEPDETDGDSSVVVYEYAVSLVESGQVLSEGCTACLSTQCQGWLPSALQVAAPLGAEYRVDITPTRVVEPSFEPDSPDAIARFCALSGLPGVYGHLRPSCMRAADPDAHTLTAASVVDEAGGILPEPASSQQYLSYDGVATERYQLISHEAGRVVIDVSSGPCEPVYASTAHDLYALLTVLEVENQ